MVGQQAGTLPAPVGLGDQDPDMATTDHPNLDLRHPQADLEDVTGAIQQQSTGLSVGTNMFQISIDP